jgi:hypothetical protein
MLCDLKALIGSPVVATDGETGSVRNFLFDDQSWKVRYLVVDVGNWLKRRDVVLPITALEKPDWGKRICHAHLTKDQVRNSPDVDTEEPVSRQQEIAMRDYFGPAGKLGRQRVRHAGHADWDEIPGTHRRGPPSAQHLTYAGLSRVGNGWRLWNPLRALSWMKASWHLGYLDVKSGDWLQNRSVLVPTRLGAVRLLG